MRSLSLRTVAVLALAFAAGCPPPASVDAGVVGDVDDGGDGGAALDTDVAALCRIYVRGYLNLTLALAGPLDQAFSRCATDDLAADPLDGGTITDDQIAQGCVPGQMFYDEFAAAAAGGRVRFDVARIQACADAYDQPDLITGEAPTDPPPLDTLPPACDGLIEPLADEGDACTQGWDCPTGLLCQADPIDAPALRCLPPAPVGAPCLPSGGTTDTSARVCAEGASCRSFVCVALGDVGDPCDDGCLEDLYCNVDVCAARGTAGSPCASDAACADDLYCDADGQCAQQLALGAACDGVASGCADACVVCRPEAPDAGTKCLSRADVGGACTTLDHCREGTLCGPAGTCVAAGAAGDACFFDDDCAADLTCEDADGGAACTPAPVPGDEGDPCGGDGDCAEELACAATGLCAPLPAIGQPCAPSGACDDAFCAGTTCAAWGEDGDDCAVDGGPGAQCRPPSFCRAGTCAAPQEGGAPCASAGACRSQTCLPAGTCAAAGPSCLTSATLFPVVVTFAAALPLFGRLRRRAR